MTQEELDALLDSGADLSEEVLENNADLENNVDLENSADLENEEEKKDDGVYPPPADEKHKVVAQLDEVTKESEEKASQVLEIISSISEDVEKLTSMLSNVLEFLKHEKEIFERLHKKFPDIKTFANELERIEEKIKEIENVLELSEDMETRLFNALEIMQYQDIHRQKIERVINIMRALIKYMNKLFEGKVSDEERVKSADYIHGDNDEVVSEDEIEELLKQFGA